MKEDCIQILSILKSVGELSWSKVFENLLKQDLDDYAFAKKVLQIYKGGINSFNDLVLSVGNNFYPQEKNQLDILRKSLYHKAIGYLGNVID